MEPLARLFLDQNLAAGLTVLPDESQCHYLRHVLRASEGQSILVFNGRQGEWEATLEPAGKKNLTATVTRQTRLQITDTELWLAFAPIKGGRVEFLVEKATELGVTRLVPILTRRTVVRSVNMARLMANAVEAAEQSERLSVPAVADAVSLERFLPTIPAGHRMLFCDESGGGIPISKALPAPGPWIVCIGPEGGFALEEREMLRACPGSLAVGLGPRVLRADTAALAAITCVQALSGDWDRLPRYKDPES
ncbi:MAG: 16S rRNA (uracil(1498)-N(3))-methyltransferase [Alphaproteobacteria bacterium]|nr:16S rRNA (uracil(1498)-N(3))-methyltransferase [Alphaproteobacteria bacterium]